MPEGEVGGGGSQTFQCLFCYFFITASVGLSINKLKLAKKTIWTIDNLYEICYYGQSRYKAEIGDYGQILDKSLKICYTV